MDGTADALLAGLDPDQRAAATLENGPAQIIAPAGSGKTATLVARAGVLLDRGTEPDRILVVTFNRDAAGELSRRLDAALRGRGVGAVPEVRTLHALARLIVLDAGRSVRLVADRLPLLRAARRRCGTGTGESVPPAEELDGLLSGATLEGRLLAPAVAAVAAAYHGLLATRGLIDFDGLMVEALGSLRRDPALRRRWQDRYEHVLVDEFQDVDAAQLDLVAILAEPQRNLFVVGDDDQP